MATSITSAFMGKLLAPIPADEEQADTKQFRKLLASDISSAWDRGMEHIRLADAHHLVAWATFAASGEPYITDHTPCALVVQAAIAARHRVYHRQYLLLAPRAVDMRWKKRMQSCTSAIPDDIAAAIAHDEARFAEGC